MPELPEVENVRRDLEKGWGSESVIQGIKLYRKDLRYPMPSPKKCRALYGLRPIRFRRQGKFLIFEFSSHSVISHLGMSGSWSWGSPNRERRIHDHIIIDLSDGAQLIYYDPRRFGSFEILSKNEFQNKLTLQSMGPDPLTSSLKPSEFFDRYIRSSRTIKTLLMDQKIIAGVGNIYACEVLFQAGVSPERTGSQMKPADWARVLTSLPKILESAVRHGGTTLKDFVHANGEKGGFQHRLRVYGRGGEICGVCSRPIVMKVLGGRSTYWCPGCQH